MPLSQQQRSGVCLLAAAILAALPQAAHAWAGQAMCPPASDGLHQDPATPPLHMCHADLAVVRTPTEYSAPATPANLNPRAALERARALWAEGNHGEALLHLRVLETALPQIADHVALLRARVYEDAGAPDRAARAYADAVERSPSSEVRATARVGRVRNILYAQEPAAEAALWALLRRYPDLPEAPALKLELAALRESLGKLRGAVALYRSLDLQLPGYPVAAEARAHLKVLRGQGVWVPPYSPKERVERAERLVQSGPPQLAHEAVEGLLKRKLPEELETRVQLAAAQLARVEGRFKDAARHATAANQPTASTDPIVDPRAAARRVTAMLRGRRLTTVLPVHLISVLEVAARAGLTPQVDRVLRELTRRAAKPPKRWAIRVPAKVRFEALYKAAGVGSTDALVALADSLLGDGRYGVAARYHRARALERGGRTAEAIAELERVVEDDRSFSRFYAQWADQRLRAMEEDSRVSACEGGVPLRHCIPRRQPAWEEAQQAFGPDVPGALAHLGPIAERFGEAYPWLPRAVDLLRVGMVREATDELHEAYLAWRGAVRRPALRAGKESVYRGAPIAKPPKHWKLRSARLRLKAREREALARASSALGDWGTAAFFGGRAWAETQPRPFEKEVTAAAARHGVDPDLLWAVMRVESVYQRRIVSYAGAVGLMQIMPRTGRLIADQLGQRDATTTDLLNPATNIDFAAWYLRSLLDRMDGRLPLAIASYNGGPHNVRKWMHRFGYHLPLDAFLEHIPFTQTRRYVRRVLGYYAKYKAQRGEKVALLDTTLPPPQADTVGF